MKKDIQYSMKVCGIESHLRNKGHFYVEKNKIISSQEVKGVEIKATETPSGVEVKVVVKKGFKIKEPLFFSFGIVDKNGGQFVALNVEVQDSAEVKLVAHCSFPNAHKITHEMEGLFRIGKNAKLFYQEHHYHGSQSGATVAPKLKVEVDEGGYYQNDFNLTKSTVGEVNIDLEAILKKGAQTDMEVKVLGRSKYDEVRIIEKVYLVGENSRSLIKMRAAAKNGGKVLMQGETYAQAPNCQGHVDCQEIVIGENSVAKAVPIVEVKRTALDGWGKILKRLFDILVAFFLLIILSPLFLILALMIKIDSAGPVFYGSKRIGGRGQSITIWKFRSMIKNAEQLKIKLLPVNERRDGPLFKLENDPRITRVGKFLRKWSLDELPQLWNVLKAR